MKEQQPPSYAYTVTAGESTPDMVTFTWPEMPPAQAGSLLTLAELDRLIDAVRARDAGMGAGAFGYFLISPANYRRIMWSYRKAQKRLWQISQKQRAQVRRQRRQQAKIRTALAYHYHSKHRVMATREKL